MTAWASRSPLPHPSQAVGSSGVVSKAVYTATAAAAATGTARATAVAAIKRAAGYAPILPSTAPPPTHLGAGIGASAIVLPFEAEGGGLARSERGIEPPPPTAAAMAHSSSSEPHPAHAALAAAVVDFRLHLEALARSVAIPPARAADERREPRRAADSHGAKRAQVAAALAAAKERLARSTVPPAADVSRSPPAVEAGLEEGEGQVHTYLADAVAAVEARAADAESVRRGLDARLAQLHDSTLDEPVALGGAIVVAAVAGAVAAGSAVAAPSFASMFLI